MYTCNPRFLILKKHARYVFQMADCLLNQVNSRTPLFSERFRSISFLCSFAVAGLVRSNTYLTMTKVTTNPKVIEGSTFLAAVLLLWFQSLESGASSPPFLLCAISSIVHTTGRRSSTILSKPQGEQSTLSHKH